MSITMSFRRHFTLKDSCKTNTSTWSEKRSRNYRQALLTGVLAIIAVNALAGAFYIYMPSEIKRIVQLPTHLVINVPYMKKPYMFRKSLDSWKQTSLKKIHLKQPSIIAPSNKLSPIESSYNFFSQYSKKDIIIPVYPTPLYLPEYRHIPPNAKIKQVSMSEELINLDDLDYGRYGGLAFQDPENKQSIKGFVHLALTWGVQLTPPLWTRRSIINLAEALKRYTNINAKVDSHLLLVSRKLSSMPFVFITADTSFELIGQERRDFREYLENGGFAVIDNGRPELPMSSAKASLRQMLRDVLGTKANFLPIPFNHPIYHCYFDFDDGPPQGSEMGMFMTSINWRCGYSALNRKMTKPVYFLEGIWLDDRLVAVYSDKGYALKWKAMSNNEPQLKMGVNMVVFALTQEGSIAQQKMDFFEE